MKNFLKSIAAGVLIGLGTYFYYYCDGLYEKTQPIIPSLVFSLGLVSIMLLNLKLFTGVVGDISSFKDVGSAVITLIGNILGTLLVSYTTPFPANYFSYLFNAKPLSVRTIFSAVLAGFIIYLCVESYRRNKKYIWITPIALTIMLKMGLYHSIVLSMGLLRPCNGFLEIFILSIIGNILGGLLGRLTLKEKKKDNDKVVCV